MKTTFFILYLILSSVCNAQAIDDTMQVDCGNTNVYFIRRCYDTVQPVAFVQVHENENTALQAVLWLLDSVQQSSFTTWHCQQQRLVDFSVGSNHYRFDPNRIYSTAGIRATLGPGVADTVVALVAEIAATFLQHYVLNKKMIIAVHNNTDAGTLSAKSYSAGGIYAKEVKAVYINPHLDADDFFYTTEEVFFQNLKRKGYNVVLQNNNTVTDDGSLSVFCASQGIPYINIESQNEHLLQQKEMLAAVWRLIESR